MADIVVCKPMQDEPAWGQFLRLAKLNGLRSRESLARLAPPDFSPSRQGWIAFRRHVARLLSGARRHSERVDYFNLHYVCPLVLGSGHWLGQHSLIDEWSVHLCYHYPCPLVVRSCGNCAQEDIEQFGFAWFKRAHQLPGVAWCWRHRSLLHERKVFGDLLRGDAWVTLQPFSRRVGSAPMQPFVSRYIRVLNWLGSPAGKSKWSDLSETLIHALRNEEGPECAYSELNKRIYCEAPSAWHEAHFLAPWKIRRRGRSIYVAENDDGPKLALRAAAISRSDQDVDALIHRTLDLASENSERMRRWLKSGMGRNESG